jgi:hypothetical protein
MILLWPPLWSSGQSSSLQIQRSGFDSQRYQIFWEVVGLERGALSLVSTIEELLGRYSSGSGLETRGYGHRDPSRWPRATLNPQKLALTSPKSGGRSVGIVPSRTQATEFVFACLWLCITVYTSCSIIRLPHYSTELLLDLCLQGITNVQTDFRLSTSLFEWRENSDYLELSL